MLANILEHVKRCHEKQPFPASHSISACFPRVGLAECAGKGRFHAFSQISPLVPFTQAMI